MEQPWAPPPPPPPASPYTTVNYDIHEEKFLPQHHHHVIFYCHFIDDVISIWSPNPNACPDALEWENFKTTMNSFPGLTWEFSDLSESVNFIDMTITINDQNHIEATLFEKKLNLHLYIPPTLPIHLGSYQGLSTAQCFEFYPLLM